MMAEMDEWLTEVEVTTPLTGNGTALYPITIAQLGADTTSYLRWNGSSWGPHSPKAVFKKYTVTFSTGGTTATVSGGTLPARNDDILVYRGPVRYTVGSSGCSGCNTTRSSSTLTFARAFASGETLTVYGLFFY